MDYADGRRCTYQLVAPAPVPASASVFKTEKGLTASVYQLKEGERPIMGAIVSNGAKKLSVKCSGVDRYVGDPVLWGKMARQVTDVEFAEHP